MNHSVYPDKSRTTDDALPREVTPAAAAMLAHTRRRPAHRVADDHPVVAELVCGHIPGAGGLRGPGAGKRIDVFATAIQTC